MGTLQTQHDMMLSFYNEFGDLNVYAKQNDTQRYIRFEFTEDVIPSDTSNFFVYIRGKYSDGSYIPIAQIKQGYYWIKTNVADINIAKIMPNPNDNIDKIYCYVGETSEYYTFGKCYKSIKNNEDKYVWTEYTYNPEIVVSTTLPSPSQSLLNKYYIYVGDDNKYGSIFKVGYSDSEIGSDYILFHIPSNLLAVPGKVVCDLVLCEGDPDAVINPDGTITSDNTKTISTHQFIIYVEPMVSSGAHVSPHETDEISELTTLLITVQAMSKEIETNEDARVTAETARIEAETARVTAEEARVTAETARISNEEARVTAETARQANEERRENAETGYIAQAKSYAIGDETARPGSSTDNAKFYYGQTKDAVYGKGLMELTIDENGHLKYTRTDDLSRYTFSIRDNKELILTYDSTLITPPTITDSEFEYDGEVKRPTITGYTAGTVMLSGDLEATEVGNYQIFVTPAPGYEWDGNYPQFVTLNWSIITS